ncbi:FHA domain-containing protein [Psychrobacter lutiphocae]|uniref:FHA domain-containing protein n=1 Tax=Psychrobacter lutiphocae TaxID=540500 RepID=UPI00037E675A|nr:FHA domain-containing protein [Psychrobacter lutiphocae]
MTTSANNSWTLTAISDSLGDLKQTFGEQLTVGRRYDNDVVISSNQVALQHAILNVENDQLTVTDLDTVHGTFINNTQVTPNEPHPVNSDDVLTFGQARFLVHFGDGESEVVEEVEEEVAVETVKEVQQEAPQADAELPSIATVADSAVADAKPWQFIAISESLGNSSFGVSDELSVGRSADNDVVIDSEQVADQHAKFSVKDGQLYVTDLGSDSGTFVHSVQAPANEAVAVHADDVVSFGALRVLVTHHADATEAQSTTDTAGATAGVAGVAAAASAIDAADTDAVWRLLAITDTLGDLDVEVTDGLTVGRGSDNNVVIDNEQVAEQHAKLSLENGQLYVTDLGSETGTLVNSIQTTANEAHLVETDDVLTFGQVRVLAHLNTGEPEVEEVVEEIAVKEVQQEAPQADAELPSIATVADSAVADAKPWQFIAISESLGNSSFGVSDELSVGRSTDNDVVIDSEQVADQHAKFSIKDGQLYVTDLGSDSGTFVHSVQAPANEAVAVNTGDVVCFGKLRVLATQQDAAPAATTGADEATAWQLVAITEALGDLTLSVANTLTVGRGTDNDIVLGSKQVSRNHAKLEVLADGNLTVTDLGSSNGTFVNSTQLVAEQAETLVEGDVVKFASFEFSVLPAVKAVTEATEASSTAPVTPEATEADEQLEEALEPTAATDTPDEVATPEEAQHDAEHKQELIKEADPEVEKARQAATGQLSGIENTSSIASNTVSEPEPRPVAHANSQVPANKAKPKSNSFVLWIVLILAALFIALWLY